MKHFQWLAILSASAKAALIPRAEEWTVGLDPIQAVITQDSQGGLNVQCQTNGKTVITASQIGFETSEGAVGPDFDSCTALKQTTDTVEYTIPVGRTTSRAASYKTQSFDCKTADDKVVHIDVRVGHDGCAFRTKVPDGQYEVTAETSKWTFTQNGASFLVSLLETSSMSHF